jgi:drug/metabolite transporter (DMT)-like permease
MAFLLYFFGAAFLLPIVFRVGVAGALRTDRRGLHVLRGVLHTAGMMLWFVALPITPLAEIIALGFTVPIFVTIGAALFLAEEVGLRRWIAVLIGTAGALIIVRPGFGEIGLGDAGFGALCVLVSTPFFAASNLISKSLSRTDSANTIVIWQHVVIVTCAAPFAIWFWEMPDSTDILWFVAAGLCGTLGHLCLQSGYRLADIALLQPIGFLALLWNTLFGFFLFGQRPDVWIFVGAAVVFGSALYVSHREGLRQTKARSGDARIGPMT